MLPTLAVSTGALLIDVSLALIALTIGFFSALWYVRFTSESSQNTSEDAKNTTQDHDGENAEAASEKEEAALQAERVDMVSLQLQDLAKNMAIDVGEHNSLMTDISSNLGELDLETAGSGTAVAEALTQIFAANSKLQDRLADAEKKIQNQAEEIRVKQSEARTDALTSLANRRAFDDVLAKNVTSFKSESRPLSLMIFDVDHFKKFNDTHGHQAGDEVLRRVGSTIAKVVKSTDIPCRYGGEEFALVMPNTKIPQAKLAAERVRKAIEELTIPFEGKSLKVTASMGIAEVTASDDETKLVRRADDAVYAAKEAGRNCGYWHDESQCLPVINPVTPKAAPAVSETKHEKAEAAPSNSVGLKSLPDRAVFLGELNRRISESHRFGVSLSVIHIRVKEYANLEKEYGDAAGQLILDLVAQFIRNTLRDMDLLGKLELGEFIVMLPGSSRREAMLVGSRVQTAIANCVIPLGDQQLRLEIQQGVTDVKPDDEAQTLMDRAEQTAELPEETVLAV
ncbi:MAG: diguanylate cyclase [Planctomycetes bacterium]|nr:diguanylate cyclase [Planctomycetota bacterium]